MARRFSVLGCRGINVFEIERKWLWNIKISQNRM